MTNVIVHYTVPAGTRFLPLHLGEKVTMLHIGQHDNYHVFEPINDYLKSNEEGLRYHRTMNERDVYEGPLDIAKFGRPVSGALSEDQRWLVNPLTYDPTRPTALKDHGEIQTGQLIPLSMDTPHDDPQRLGDYARASTTTTSDVDIGLLGELGLAVTRGANLVAEDPHIHWQAPTGRSEEPGHHEHAARPVPPTAPHTPETAMAHAIASPMIHGGLSMHSEAATAYTSTLGSAAEAGLELCATTASAAVGAYGGSIAGEMIGGDLAVAHLGSFAEPVGQGIGRHLGTLVGGAVGAAAIRCSSRSATRARTSSQVRFAPEIQLQDHNFRPTLLNQHGEIQKGPYQMQQAAQAPVQPSTPASSDAILVAIQANSATNSAELAATRAEQAANTKDIMENMAKMFGMARSESLQREDVLRGEIQEHMSTVQSSIGNLEKNSAKSAAQVDHLTTTVTSFREQLDVNADFSVDAVQQVREEFNARFDALAKLIPASNAGGTGALSSSDEPLVNITGKPRECNVKDIPFAIKCSYCDGDVPKVIAKHCADCDLHFHPGHLQLHRDEWPCPLVDYDLCPWCAEHIEEEHGITECDVCQYTMHNHCFVQHNPCPEGWTNKEKSGAEKLEHIQAKTEPDLPGPLLPGTVTPPVRTDPSSQPLSKELARTTNATANATALANKFLADMEAIQRGNLPQQQYPTSPTKEGTNSLVPLANLGVAPGAVSTAGFAVQYGKPREADAVKLLAFPKPGTSFEKWWDHALDSISAATSFCTEAYRWALQCEKSETTFAALAESGGFVRLDALLLTALMECIPGDTHLLRQEIKKAKTEQRMTQQRNITGRQVLMMVHRFFAMNEKDKQMTDTARLHKITLQNGDIQQFIYKWDEMLSLMTRRPPDDDLMNLFVLQFDVHLAKNHEFYVEYLFWYNRPAADVTRSYEGLWTLVHDWVRRKKDTKNRKEALKDHVPGLAGVITPKGKGKGTGKDKNGVPQVCFAWRNDGICPKKDAGTCQYTHPRDVKGKGKPGGGKGANGKNRSASTSSRGGKGKADSAKRSASPRTKAVTDVSKLCKNYLKGKCDKGDACKYHHNGPCHFHAKGSCKRGDDCIFQHATVPAAAAVQPLSAAAKKAAKKAADNENA